MLLVLDLDPVLLPATAVRLVILTAKPILGRDNDVVRVSGARTIPPTNERGLLHRWHDRDNPSSWAAGSIFLDGPDHAEKS